MQVPGPVPTEAGARDTVKKHFRRACSQVPLLRAQGTPAKSMSFGSLQIRDSQEIERGDFICAPTPGTLPSSCLAGLVGGF